MENITMISSLIGLFVTILGIITPIISNKIKNKRNYLEYVNDYEKKFKDNLYWENKQQFKRIFDLFRKIENDEYKKYVIRNFKKFDKFIRLLKKKEIILYNNMCIVKNEFKIEVLPLDIYFLNIEMLDTDLSIDLLFKSKICFYVSIKTNGIIFLNRGIIKLVSIDKINRKLIKIKWDVINDDTLQINKYNNKMDYVVGNPPYINIHNLKNINYKNFNFTKKGSIDLYLIFFEIGIKMLNNKGKLIYITPNSFLTSKAGSYFRKYIIQNKILRKYIDNKHKIIFESIQTYTGITLLDKNWNKNHCLYINNDLHLAKNANKNYSEFYINDKFYFNASKDNYLTKILSYKLNNNLIIRNGLATNANSIFLNYPNISPFSKKIFKIRNLNKKNIAYQNIIFPYDNNFDEISINEIKKSDCDLYSYFIKNKNKLSSRKSIDSLKWWCYSRTQGFSALNSNKLVISNIMRSEEQVILRAIEKEVLVYGSGYYIISNLKKYDLQWIIKLFEREKSNFIEYLKLIGKNKGYYYYFFNSDDLNRFISYHIDIDIKNKTKYKISLLNMNNKTTTFI